MIATGIVKNSLYVHVLETNIYYIYSPVAANKNSYKTYEKEWTVPADIIPGSYAFDFLEVAQTRRRPDLQVSETIKVHVVD